MGTTRERARKTPSRLGWRGWLKALGPGLVTGSADDDPSGVATYAQAGAQYGFAVTWTAPVVLPMMIGIQEMCDRTATTTGQTLGRLARRRFRRGGELVVGFLLLCLLVSNVVNVGADLMAVGKGMELLGAGPSQVWAPIAGLGLAVLLMTGSYKLVSKIFVWLCLVLFAYVIVMFLAGVQWGEVLAGMTFQRLQPGVQFWGLVAAVFGTSISPYLFFWESGQRIEEMRARPEHGDKPAADTDIPDFKAIRRRRQQRIDVVTGMTVSVVVMLAIIVATGATIGRHPTDISSAADAAQALKPLAGPLAGAVFALGFIGTGLLGVPVLASAACIGISGLTGKAWGFDRSPRKAPLFYGLLLAGLIVGTILASMFTDAIALLVLSAMLNAIAAAPFLVVVLLIAGNRAIMGKRTNGRLSNTVGWVTAGIMGAAGILAIWAQFAGG
ncbi:Nramp family divalent metal transporter [Sinomonas terrae]|uniref:Nramp family divalent metal transporter n=1 Tax=Sinomonas terrae TaxID=2908838 RepID=A0ABS9TXE9_9MICC|nr:Nramp family divalent metal transporter [Sinomonas terrae]MCH6469099.1 Nramp family divalent metal transporter [Sinomonas terrae]